MSSTPWIAVAILESGLWAGLLFVGHSLVRSKVNGPCSICLSLVFAWRISVIGNMQCGTLRWDYVWGVLFAYSFVYATYHLAGLVQRIRAYDPQPLQGQND